MALSLRRTCLSRGLHLKQNTPPSHCAHPRHHLQSRLSTGVDTFVSVGKTPSVHVTVPTLISHVPDVVIIEVVEEVVVEVVEEADKVQLGKEEEEALGSCSCAGSGSGSRQMPCSSTGAHCTGRGGGGPRRGSPGAASGMITSSPSELSAKSL